MCFVLKLQLGLGVKTGGVELDWIGVEKRLNSLTRARQESAIRMDQHAVQIQIGVDILLTIATVKTALTIKEVYNDASLIKYFW